MKHIHYITILCCILQFLACNNFKEATYDGPVPMTLINSDRFQANFAGNKVYLNPDDGSLEFGGSEFRVADFFSCGLAYVVETGDNPRRGFINRDNQLIIEYKRDDWESLSGFSDGLAIGKNYDFEYMVFNTKGEIIRSLSASEWAPITLYKDGYSVWIRHDLTWGIMDTEGNMHIYKKYRITQDYPNCYPAHGLICVYDEEGFDTLYGAMDIESEELVIPCKFNKPFMFDRNGYAVVQDPETKKYGLINRKGEYTIPAIFTSIQTDGPDLYKCGFYDDSFTKEYSYSWIDHKKNTVVGGGPTLNQDIYFFSGRPQFVKIDYDKNGRAVGYILFHRNLLVGESFSDKVSGEDYREFLSYPVALRNGNSIGFYQPAAYDRRCLLLDKDFRRVGSHEFHVESSSILKPSEEMLRLQLFYTHGIPYVMDNVLGNI